MIHTINYQVRDYFGLSCSRYLEYKTGAIERRVKLSVTWRKNGLSDYDIAQMLRDLGRNGVIIGSTSDVASSDGRIITGWPLKFEIEDAQKSSSEIQMRTDVVKSNLARLQTKSDRPVTKPTTPAGSRPTTPARVAQRPHPDVPDALHLASVWTTKPAPESAPAPPRAICIDLPAAEDILVQDEAH